MNRILSIIFVAVAVMLIFQPGYGTAAGKLIHLLTLYNDKKEGPIIAPEGVGCNDQSLVIVADTGNGRLVKYSIVGDTVQDGSAITLTELSYPIRVGVTPGGDIYVLDGLTRRIVHIGPDGKFREYIEPRGMPAPAQMIPRSFKVGHDGNLYILDVLNNRVVVSDASGGFVRQVSFPRDYGFFSDLAVSRQGGLFLLDSVGKMIYSLDETGQKFVPFSKRLDEYLNFPTAFTTDANGSFYIVDQNGGGIVSLGVDGSYQGRQSSMGWNEGLLRYPSQICVNERSAIVADRQNNRVQIFSIVQ